MSPVKQPASPMESDVLKGVLGIRKKTGTTQRYFALSHTRLSYWRSEAEAAEGQCPRGSVEAGDMVSASMSGEDLVITIVGNKKFTLCKLNESQDLLPWFQTIQQFDLTASTQASSRRVPRIPSGDLQTSARSLQECISCGGVGCGLCKRKAAAAQKDAVAADGPTSAQQPRPQHEPQELGGSSAVSSRRSSSATQKVKKHSSKSQGCSPCDPKGAAVTIQSAYRGYVVRSVARTTKAMEDRKRAVQEQAAKRRGAAEAWKPRPLSEKDKQLAAVRMQRAFRAHLGQVAKARVEEAATKRKARKYFAQHAHMTRNWAGHPLPTKSGRPSRQSPSPEARRDFYPGSLHQGAVQVRDLWGQAESRHLVLYPDRIAVFRRRGDVEPQGSMLFRETESVSEIEGGFELTTRGPQARQVVVLVADAGQLQEWLRRLAELDVWDSEDDPAPTRASSSRPTSVRSATPASARPSATRQGSSSELWSHQCKPQRGSTESGHLGRQDSSKLDGDPPTSCLPPEPLSGSDFDQAPRRCEYAMAGMLNIEEDGNWVSAYCRLYPGELRLWDSETQALRGVEPVLISLSGFHDIGIEDKTDLVVKFRPGSGDPLRVRPRDMQGWFTAFVDVLYCAPQSQLGVTFSAAGCSSPSRSQDKARPRKFAHVPAKVNSGLRDSEWPPPPPSQRSPQAGQQNLGRSMSAGTLTAAKRPNSPERQRAHEENIFADRAHANRGSAKGMFFVRTGSPRGIMDVRSPRSIMDAKSVQAECPGNGFVSGKINSFVSLNPQRSDGTADKPYSPPARPAQSAEMRRCSSWTKIVSDSSTPAAARKTRSPPDAQRVSSKITSSPDGGFSAQAHASSPRRVIATKITGSRELPTRRLDTYHKITDDTRYNTVGWATSPRPATTERFAPMVERTFLRSPRRVTFASPRSTRR